MDGDFDDENDFYDEEEVEIPPPPKQRRLVKPTAKKAALEEENIAGKLKKVQQLQQEIQHMKQKKSKSKENEPEEPQENDFESEEETIPSGFSSSIRALGPASFASNTTHANRTALKRVGAAAARMPSQAPRLSSNAFKTLTAPANANNDNEINGSNHLAMPSTNESQDSSSLDELSGHSSPCITHVNTISNRRPRSSSASLAAGDAASAAKKAKVSTMETSQLIPTYREGAEVNPRKPRASDFADIVHALILRAASEYEALISTKDAFPDTATRNKWAKLCWKNAGLAAAENYTLSDAINVLLRGRGSRIRGHAVTCIRPLLVSHMGFKRSGDPKIVAANVALFTKLKGSAAFHYKDPEMLSGFAQGKIISEVLNAVWFEDKRSQGIVFESLFSPVSFETLALIFTIIDFCLDEWSTGKRIKATLWEKDVIDRHRVFRLDLEEWEKLNSVAVLGHRKKLYLRASRHAGAIETSKTQKTLVGEALDCARNELEGRTGETDSEAEG